MSQMLHGITHVDAPAIVPTEGGLFSAAEVIDLSGDRVHEIMGVQFDASELAVTHLGDMLVSYDPDSCIATDELAHRDGFDVVQSDDQFTIYTAVECINYDSTEFESAARRRLELNEQTAVERYLWTNVYPRYAEDVTPTAGTAVKLKTGLGILAEEAGLLFPGKPILHAGRRTAPFFNEDTIDQKFMQYVNGAGYVSSVDGPWADDEDPESGVAAPTGAVWLYMTGPIQLRRLEPFVRLTTHYQYNKPYALAERQYSATVAGKTVAVLVTLEG
jgi:hypothetical protein